MGSMSRGHFHNVERQKTLCSKEQSWDPHVSSCFLNALDWGISSKVVKVADDTN